MVALGLVLVAVAVLFLLVEAHLGRGGLIAGGAVLALIGGVAVLLIAATAGLLAVLAVSAGVGFSSVGGLLVIGRSMRPFRRLRPRSGAEAMIGHVGVMRGAEAARVFVDGGLWRAEPGPLEEASALHDGDRVVIERVTGLTLSVRKADELELNP